MSTENSKKPPRLHELIAVRSGLKSQAAKTMADLANTFEKKQHHFSARVKSFIPNSENGDGSAAAKVEEQLDLQTTVSKELAWISEYLVKALDANHAVNQGNTAAKADIVLEGGQVLAANLPAQTLLELEGEIETLRDFCSKIPTLDPAKGFQPDASREPGVFKAREIERTRTAKQNKVIVLYPATDKHPAQTQLVTVDEPVGVIREQEWSSMLTVAQKGAIMDRVEKLLRAVKKARSRANDTEVSADKIGASLINYVFGV
jgi:hypothetical protein